MCSVDVATVVADAQELESPAFAPWHGTFDLVYATVGLTCWIADLDAWMRGAAALLKGGGQLVLIDLHPLYCMVESLDPLVVDFPYVNDGVRHLEGTGSYANPNAALTWSTDQFAWSIGETVNAAIAAGLAVAFLDEHDASPYDPRGDVLAGEDDGMYRLRIGSGVDGRPAEPLPIMFTLVVRKSSSAENS